MNHHISNLLLALLLLALPAAEASGQPNAPAPAEQSGTENSRTHESSKTPILTLDSCKTLALAQNARIQKQSLAVEDAEIQRKEALTHFFPQISATGVAVQFDKPQLSMDMEALVNQPLTLEMLKSGVAGAVMAQWPIFVGGQIVNGHRLARVGYDVSRLQLAQTRYETELTTEQYYWQIISLQEKLKTLEAMQTMLQAIGHDVQAFVDAGLTTRNDLLQVQLQQNRISSSILTLSSNLRICRMLLSQYIGLGLDTTHIIAGSIDPAIEVPSPDAWLTDHAAALASTPEYGLARQNVRAQDLQYKIEVGSHLPSVAIGTGYSYTNLLRNDMGFGENDKKTMMMFAMVSVPLSDWWGGSYAIRRKKNASRTARLDLQDAEQMLLIRMQSTYSAFDDAYQQVGIARKSIEQSQENLRMEQDKYTAGTTTMSDLLQAQTLHQQALDGYVDAWTQYQTKRLEYLQATGR